MATLPINLEVEDVAVGPVLIALRKMPGIIKMNLDLGDGPRIEPKGPRVPITERIIAMLVEANGTAVTIGDILQATGALKTSLGGPLGKMRTEGIIKKVGRGTYILSPKAAKDLIPSAMKMLPKPRSEAAAAKKPIKQVATPGRTAAGTSRELIMKRLIKGPMSASDLRAQLESEGMTAKSVGNALYKGKAEKVFALKDKLYSLTAGGTKVALETAGA